MKRDILLAKQGVIIIDGEPFRFPGFSAKNVPKTSKKTDMVKWLRTALSDLYSKFILYLILIRITTSCPWDSKVEELQNFI
jgi:hypothetical protein